MTLDPAGATRRLMQIIRQLQDLPNGARGGAVAIGNFDGVHRGHLRIVRRVLERARELGGPSLVFTFDPHPVRLLRPHECPPPLTWTERKAELLAVEGIDWLVAYPTDEALLGLSAADFFGQIVRGALDARALVEGPNFFFGHNREGNVQVLADFAESSGLTLDVVDPLEIDGAIVSSSRIRRLISEGQVEQASRLLSAPYRVRGMVTHGAGRGAAIGFPTANLDAVDTLLPGVGVYAGQGTVGGQTWPAAINLGPNPTFDDNRNKLEVHLVGCKEALYGKPLVVDFFERLREIRSFESADTLRQQLSKDMEAVQSFFADHHVNSP